MFMNVQQNMLFINQTMLVSVRQEVMSWLTLRETDVPLCHLPDDTSPTSSSASDLCAPLVFVELCRSCPLDGVKKIAKGSYIVNNLSVWI